jgi:hypothetical protein
MGIQQSEPDVSLYIHPDIPQIQTLTAVVLGSARNLWTGAAMKDINFQVIVMVVEVEVKPRLLKAYEG